MVNVPADEPTSTFGQSSSQLAPLVPPSLCCYARHLPGKGRETLRKLGLEVESSVMMYN